MLQLFNKTSHTAVLDNSTHYSYDSMRKRVDLIACFFKKNNIKRIMIDLPQCYNAYCLMWASYLSNATFCCVNEQAPSNYKNYCVETFCPNLIIYNQGDMGNAFIEIIKNNPKAIKVEFQNENIQFVSKETAYVLFTSGTTGKPKGVAVKRRALESFVEWCKNNYSLSSNDVYGQYSNISFDLGVGDVFFGCNIGATMVPISGYNKFIPGQIIKKFSITFWHSVPSVLDLFIRKGDIQSGVLCSLKEVTFCGEPLYPSQLEYLFDYYPEIIAWNTYGPTEATIFCSALKLNKSNNKRYSKDTVSIGVPITGFKFSFTSLDDNQYGLTVYSDNVAFGYINEVNNNGFIYNDDKQSCGFETGDIIKKINGSIYFVGRKDNQVKVGGYRIDLNEIDSIIRANTIFCTCTVLYNNKIITFVEYNTPVSYELIRSVVKENLPIYYLPSKVITIKEIPKNLNGKYDRNKLVTYLN